MSRATTIQLTVTESNYFEVAIALHTFLTVNHEGQGSTKYQLLSRSPFNPGPMFSESSYLEDNEDSEEYQAISAMTDEQLDSLLTELNDYLDTL